MSFRSSLFALTRTLVRVGIATCVVAPTALATQSNSESAAMTGSVIHLGQVRTEQHGSGQAVNYEFDARNGEDVLIELHQSGLDFVITVVDPDGNSGTFNSPLRRDEREFVVLESPIAGRYQITVHSDEPTNSIGQHSLGITRLDSITDGDSRYVEAMRLMSTAAALYDPADRERSIEALDAYRNAVSRWQALGRSREYAQSLYSVAMLEYWFTGDWSRAAEVAREAAVVYKELSLDALHANTTLLQGIALIEQASQPEHTNPASTYAEALTLFETAAEIQGRLGNQYELALITNNTGMMYLYSGDWDKARSSWVDAADQFQQLGEWREEMNARQNQAVIDGLRGYNARAIETLSYIVDAFPEDKDPLFRVNVLDNLAENLRRFGNYEEALKNYSTARDLHHQIDDLTGEAYSLIGIGKTYISIGELDLAREHLEIALPKSREAKDARSQEAILARLGDIAYLQSDFGEAIEKHRQALELADSAPNRAFRMLPVAKDLMAMGRFEASRRIASDAAQLAEESKAVAIYAESLLQVAKADAMLGRPEVARSSFEQALETYQSLGLGSGQADALHGLAKAALAVEQFDDAIRFNQASVAVIESLRDRVSSPELRAHYSAASRDYYESQISTYLARANAVESGSEEFVRAAFTTSENARARLTMDLLREASVDLRARVDSELLQEERLVLEELAARSQQLERLLQKKVVDEPARQQITELNEAMTTLENRLHVIRVDMRRDEANVRELAVNNALDAAQIQQLLDDDAVLLQYHMADDKSFGWAVTRDQIVAIELADGSTVQRAVVDLLQSINILKAKSSDRAQLNSSLRRLTELVVDPFATQLAAKRRLLVSPDGSLEYVPFGVLPSSSDPDSKPIIESHEVITLPSVSVVKELRSRAELNTESQIAIFGDPVVGKQDSRLSATDQPGDVEAPLNAALTRSGSSLGRLPSTAVEAEVIASMVPATDRYLALGFDANREQVLSMDLSGFRFLHFATHGVINARYPALSSLELSRFDSDGNARDGSLRLYDIFDLDLNASLVVLSACDTALGRQIRGEGLFGLAQGFMYAGAKSMLISLWQVPDRATAELMTRFYGYMLDSDDPHTPAAALRKAQVSLSTDRRWRHPYYWGAFVLLGDWQ